MMHWAAPLIGKPWKRGAVGPRAFDCWGLVRHVQRTQYGREMPELTIGDLTSEQLADLHTLIRRSRWHRMPDSTQPLDGDVFLMHGPEGPHVGIGVLADGVVALLHAIGSEDDPGTVIYTPLDTVSANWGRLELWRFNEDEK